MAVLSGIALALGAWFAGVALFALAFAPERVIVFGPRASVWSAVTATDAELLSQGDGYMTLRSGGPGFVRSLYSNGAWLVWPALSAGCLGVTRGVRTR